MSYILKIIAQREFVAVPVEGVLTLEVLQNHVGGLIEICYNAARATPPGLTALCDEDGLRKGLDPVMMSATHGMIVGPVVWVIHKGEHFVPMSQSQKREATKFLSNQGFTETILH